MKLLDVVASGPPSSASDSDRPSSEAETWTGDRQTSAAKGEAPTSERETWTAELGTSTFKHQSLASELRKFGLRTANLDFKA